MDTRGKQYRVAKWTDERGENTLMGFVNEQAPRFTLDALLHPESVAIPEGAAVYRAAQPEMVLVGHVVNGVVA